MTAYRRQGHTLAPELQRAFELLRSERGDRAACRALGITACTLDKVAAGQGVRGDVLAKVTAALRSKRIQMMLGAHEVKS